MKTMDVKRWLNTYPQESYVLILASLVNSAGSALMWPLTTIYVHNILHRSYADAGFVLLFQSLAGIVGQFLGGSLYHRLGARKLIVGSLLLSGCAQFSLIFAKAWLPYLTAMVLNGFLNAVTMPSVNAFIGFRWREQRIRLFNAVYVFNNIGVAIGTTLAGLLAAISFDLTFLFNSVSTVGFSIFFYVFMRSMQMDAADLDVNVSLQADDGSILSLLRDYRMYLFVAIGTLLVSVATSAWNSGVAPFLNSEGLSPARYSFLWTVNGIVIIIGQPFTSLLNRWVTKTLYGRLIGSGAFYAAGFGLMLIWHHEYVYFIIGMIVCTFGEMSLNPTVPAIISQTTGKSAPFYLGLVGGFTSMGRIIGPPLFGHMSDVLGVSPILAVAALATTAAAVSFTVHRAVRPFT
ncbi:MAG: MFS transporter [Alicyclobacillus sp.]|nr:MFS transporter [Alicyclobacillus sp.]